VDDPVAVALKNVARARIVKVSASRVWLPFHGRTKLPMP